MKQIRTADDVKRLGAILSIWAHPDDETFSCAGIMATAISHGQSVACITATKGEAGVQDESRWPAAQLAEIREHELDEALHVLGVHHHNWLDYHDGHCAEADSHRAAQQLATFIDLYQPDTILTFGPDGMTGHSDHQTISKWVDLALKQTTKQPVVYHAVQLKSTYEKYLKAADKQLDIFFNIDKPPLKDAEECDICLTLSPEICHKKSLAFKAMPSQTEGLTKHFDDKTLESAFSPETFVRR